MDLVALSKIKHNGVTYSPGEVIKGITKKDIQRLISLGVAKEDLDELNSQESNLNESENQERDTQDSINVEEETPNQPKGKETKTDTKKNKK